MPGRSSPKASSAALSVMPNRSRAYPCAQSDSEQWVCTGTPVDAASSPRPRSRSSVQAGVKRGVMIGRTRPRPASMAVISSIDRALAATPAAAEWSRYHSGVPSGWSMATRPTKARWPASAAARASAEVASTSMVAK